jgi:uncharacterized protein
MAREMQAATLQQIVAQLAAEAGANGARKLPPVDLWNPERCSTEGDFRIRADGTWFHDGAPFTRPALVRLFSTILRKDEDGSTWLVTPGEKVAVQVEDAPFLAVRAERIGEGADQAVAFTTNVGDVVVAGADHPLRVEIDPTTQEPRPYVRIRGRLDARILRPQFYDLVDWAEPRDGVLTLVSQGVSFPLGAA